MTTFQGKTSKIGRVPPMYDDSTEGNVTDLRRALANQLVLVSALLEVRDHLYTTQDIERVRAFAANALAQTLKK